MRLYEATLYERPLSGLTPQPVYCEGKPVAQEIAAENAGKARYSFWLDLRDAWGDHVRLQDIRVLSLSKGRPRFLATGWEERLEQANAIIRVIGSYGRHFLSENSDRRVLVADPFFAHFKVDKRNEVWFVDRYSRKANLVRLSDWPHFSDGGTLRDLVKHLANYIAVHSQINLRIFGPWAEWVCSGDLWGYGEDMQKVRDGIKAILEVK